MYKVYYILGRRIIAVPAVPQDLSLFGWKRYRARTPKRAMIRKFMQYVARLYLDRFFYKLVPSPFHNENSFPFEEWLDKIRTDLGLYNAHPVIIWPPQKNRGRVYVHLIQEDGRPLCFIKISFDERNAESSLKELRTLRLLSERTGQDWHIPSVLAEDTWNGYEYLITEPLPFDARPIEPSLESYPEECIQQIGGPVRVAEFREVETFPWWHQFCDIAKKSSHVNTFKEELQELIISNSGLPVCQVHGDLGPANLAFSGDQLWIFDWEESTDIGPVLTDKIGFDLAVHTKKIRRQSDTVLKSFKNRYLNDPSPEKRRDVMAALAFRLKFEKPVTEIYVRNWANMRI